MKDAPIVNLEGYIIDVGLVADGVTDVFPIYALPKPGTEAEAEETEPTEQEITGYKVAVSVPPGLYKPRFDLAAWDDYQEALEAYNAAMGAWYNTPERDRGEQSVLAQFVFWVEGLTQEEIDEIRNKPVPKSLQEQLNDSLAQAEQLRQDLAVQKDINTANSQNFMALVDYLAEKGVLN